MFNSWASPSTGKTGKRYVIIIGIDQTIDIPLALILIAEGKHAGDLVTIKIDPAGILLRGATLSHDMHFLLDAINLATMRRERIRLVLKTY